MNKKDFQAISTALADGHNALLATGNPSAEVRLRITAIQSAMWSSIADVLALQNPKFKRQVFLDECRAQVSIETGTRLALQSGQVVAP